MFLACSSKLKACDFSVTVSGVLLYAVCFPIVWINNCPEKSRASTLRKCFGYLLIILDHFNNFRKLCFCYYFICSLQQKRENPTMTTSTITAMRKGDPQHMLRENKCCQRVTPNNNYCNHCQNTNIQLRVFCNVHLFGQHIFLNTCIFENIIMCLGCVFKLYICILSVRMRSSITLCIYGDILYIF